MAHTPSSGETRREFLTRGNVAAEKGHPDGVALSVFASPALGAVGLSTGTLGLLPGTAVSGRQADRGVSLTVLRGSLDVGVGRRRHRLEPYDSLFVPPGSACVLAAGEIVGESLLHWATPGEPPGWMSGEAGSSAESADAGAGDSPPERLVRFESAPVYGLAEGTSFRDLFAGRLGSRGICGGYGWFEPGRSLPCHYHDYDESITIVTGSAICQVAGQEYELSDNDTACIPRGRPHRFLNRSDRPMAMIWVYAGDEPDRVIVDPALCSGAPR